MAFNYGFDGLDFLPSLTFPGHQSLGNVNHSPFEDALATPRQSNGWTLSELIELNLAGPSQLPVDDRQYSLDGGFASNSFDPASDICWGDISSRQTTEDGSSDASAGGQEASLAPQDFNLSAQDAIAFPYLSMPVPSSSLAQPASEDVGDATFATGEVTSEDPLRGSFLSSFDGDQQASQGASSFRYEGLRDTQAIASSSEVSPARLSGPAVPPTSNRSTSSAASHPQAVSTAGVSAAATRSLWKAPNAVAGPSRLVPIAPREATVQVEAPAVTELRRSSRKRTAPAAGYAEAAVLPPPAKKRKGTNGSAPKVRPTAAAVETSVEEHAPVAGPSRQATRTAKPSAKKARSAKAPSKKGTEAKRPRRTRAQVDMHKVAGMPTHACDVDGCALIWNPYKHEDNKEHLETHFDTADLEGDADLVCVFDVCKVPVPGKDLLQHMEIHHTGRPYLCPIRCGWQSCRSSYQKQHMDLMHEGVLWE